MDYFDWWRQRLRRPLVLELPLPPSVNVRLGRTTGQRHKGAGKASQFYRDVHWLWRQSGSAAFLRDDRLAAFVTLHGRRMGRLPDLDNPLKCLLDALTKAGVWPDDGQLDVLVVDRGPRTQAGACIVCIGVVEPQEAA